MSNFPVTLTAMSPLAVRSELHREALDFTDDLSDELYQRLKGKYANPIKLTPLRKVATFFRTKTIDKLVLELIEQKKVDTIINLGCGYCTRYSRLKYPDRLKVIDVDHREIIANRIALGMTTANHEAIAVDLSELKNFDLIIARHLGPRTLIIAEGVFHYLPRIKFHDLMEIFMRLNNIAYLIFDVYHPIVALFSFPSAMLRQRGVKLHTFLGSRRALKFVRDTFFVREKRRFNLFTHAAQVKRPSLWAPYGIIELQRRENR